MTKQELAAMVNEFKSEMKDSLQIVYDALNNGQRNKLMKNEKVKALFERYGVGGDA